MSDHHSRRGNTQPLPLTKRRLEQDPARAGKGSVLAAQQVVEEITDDPSVPLPPLRARAYQPPKSPPPPTEHATFDMQTVRVRTPVMSQAETNSPQLPSDHSNQNTTPSVRVQQKKRRARWLGATAGLLFLFTGLVTWKVFQLRQPSTEVTGDRTLGAVHLSAPRNSTNATTPSKSTVNGEEPTNETTKKAQPSPPATTAPASNHRSEKRRVETPSHQTEEASDTPHAPKDGSSVRTPSTRPASGEVESPLGSPRF